MGQDNRDDSAMLEERIAGRSIISIAEQYECATGDVDAAIDRRLNFALDNDMRLKAVKLDVARLEALMVPFFERATKDRDCAAGTLCCKLLEHRALLLGLAHPTQSRIDVYQIEQRKQPSQYEQIKAAIMGLANQQPPAEREAHNLVRKVGGERALELLRGALGNGDGVDPETDPEPEPEQP